MLTKTSLKHQQQITHQTQRNWQIFKFVKLWSSKIVRKMHNAQKELSLAHYTKN